MFVMPFIAYLLRARNGIYRIEDGGGGGGGGGEGDEGRPMMMTSVVARLLGWKRKNKMWRSRRYRNVGIREAGMVEERRRNRIIYIRPQYCN